MIHLGPLGAALALLLTAGVVRSTLDPRQARARGALGSGIVLVALVLLLGLDVALGVEPRFFHGVSIALLPQGMLRLTPLVSCAVGVLAVSLAPLASHPPRTLAAVLVLIAIALAFVAAPYPGVLAILWCLSAWTLWSGLGAQAQLAAGRRVFAVYHALSAGLALLGTLLMGGGSATLGVGCWLLAIAVREAVIPLHGWLPALIQRAPLGLVLAFVGPQLGVYAHLELATRPASGVLSLGLAGAGAITAVLASALGLVQKDARRAFAFLLISQTGLVAFGLENKSHVAEVGALVYWQVLALATTGFGMTIAALEARRGTLSIQSPSGSFARTPRMAVAFLFLGFASVGLPGTLGFVAEDLLIQGSIDEFSFLAFALILATALNGISVLRCFFALFSGRGTHAGESDLTRRERAALSMAVVALLLGGAFARPILGLHERHPATEPGAHALNQHP